MHFRTTALFDKQAKKLHKKYKHLKDDIAVFVAQFETLHLSSVTISSNIHKIRIANSDKNRGKSAGYRIYYYLYIEETVYLLTIYDKSETEMIDEALLGDMIQDIQSC